MVAGGRLKNAASRLFQDLVRVSARHRLLLTGTPLQNNLEELFFLMNFLEPAKFPSVEAFSTAYAALDDKDKVRPTLCVCVVCRAGLVWAVMCG